MKHTKTLLALLLAVVMVCVGLPLVAAEEPTIVDSGTCGENLMWTLDNEGTLTISGEGRMDSFGWSRDEALNMLITTAPWRQYHGDIRTVLLEDGVTSVGYGSFYGCSVLESVTFPDSLQNIGGGAFCYCSALNNVTFPDGLQSVGHNAFSNCTALESVTFPDSLQSIDYNAFYYCTALESVTFGNSLQSIGQGAFAECPSLRSVIVSDNVSFIGNRAFGSSDSPQTLILCNKDSYAASWAESSGLPYALLDGTDEENTISETVNSKVSYSIDRRTRTLTVSVDGKMPSFSGDAPWKQYRQYIETVAFSDGCTSISKHAFSYYKNLKAISLSDSIESIENGAFFYCTSIQDVTIADGVTSVAYDAFYGCSSLQQVSIGESLLSFDGRAFMDCPLLSAFSVKESNPYFSSHEGVLYNKDKTILVRCPEAKKVLTIPSSVIRIEEWAFGYSSLKQVTLPNGLQSIGYGAFLDSSDLESIVIPDSVTELSGAAFLGCSSLKSMTISGTIASIGFQMFQECVSLETVIIKEGVQIIMLDAFASCGKLESVTVPSSVTSIGENAFTGSGLRDIYILSRDCSIADDSIYCRAAIHGYIGSTAQTYAEQFGHTFIPLDDCEHVFGAWEESPAATCTEAGLLVRRCEICGTREEEILPALGHDYTETVVEATCTAAGYTLHVCARCGDRYGDAFTDPLGHALDAGTAVSPTCTKPGYTIYACTRCDWTETEETAAPLGHDLDTGTVIAPTCTEAGYVLYACTRCDWKELEKTEEPCGHDYQPAESAAPTCLSEGYTVYRCAACGDSYTETLPVGDHSFGAWRTYLPADGADDSIDVRFCTVCGLFELRPAETPPDDPTDPTDPTNPTDPTQPSTEEPTDDAPQGFFARIGAFFRNLFDKIFGIFRR